MCGACPWADTEEFFVWKLFLRNKKKTLGKRQTFFFFGCSAFKFLLCVWPALRMMQTHFHCNETNNFIWQGFSQKEIGTTIFLVKNA
jgi:hypothetical protein